MKRWYEDHKFQASTMSLLNQVIAIVGEYDRQGYRMTLRQLYYQLVARAISWNVCKVKGYGKYKKEIVTGQQVFENKLSNYSMLSGLLTDARMAGLVDWDFIEDRVREASRPSEWSGIPAIIRTVLRQYRRPRWATQEKYVEVMVEKNALIGVLEPITEEYHTYITPNVGYSSTTAIHDAALRFEEAEEDDKECVLLYFGDHDPSGEDMVADVQRRLEKFEVEVDVQKVALTMEQIRQYNPPPNPVKRSDSRANSYIAEHGEHSWELDALPPNVLVQLLRVNIEDNMDMDAYEKVIQQEEKDKRKLEKLIKDHFKEDDSDDDEENDGENDE